MLMNIKGSNIQNTPHQNISKIFQTQPLLLISPSPQSKGCEDRAIKSVEIEQDDSVTNSETMEVSVDPGMYLDEESIVIEDDEETVSAAEAKIETAKLRQLKEGEEEIVSKSGERSLNFTGGKSDSNQILKDEEYICTSCLETFSSNTELQNHTMTTCTKVSESAITKTSKKKKQKEEKLRSRRKKIIIRINPSPIKRNARERAKILPAKICRFSCAICKKTLSR